MLRVAATLLALLAALPAVTPLLGGYKVFTSDCGRNLTHLGPSRKWPELPARTYNYTGLLVMPDHLCSGALVTPKFMLSTSLCRLWKGHVNLANDIEEDGSEVRIGIIQGDVPRHLYQRQLVTRYLHYDKKMEKLIRTPLMLVEVEREFSGWGHETLPGVYQRTTLSGDPKAKGFKIIEVVGYENSANLAIFHQAIFDARVWKYEPKVHKYGHKKWELSQGAICTFDVSPVRTVCSIDRGAPIMWKKNIVGFVVGFVDDMETPGNFCGEGRIHYNIFMTTDDKSAEWLNEQTDGMVKIMDLIDGRPSEVRPDNNRPAAPGKPSTRPPRPPRPTTTTRRPREDSGSGRQMVSLWTLLLSVAVTIVRLVFQY